MSAKIHEDTLVALASQQVSGQLMEGEVVVLSLKDGVYYGLKETGGRIWSLLSEPRRVSQIRDILLAEYEVDPQRCTDELIAVLEDMLAKGLVEARDEPPA